MNQVRPAVTRRNQRIIFFYKLGLTRKNLAYRFRLNYEVVKKIIQGIERRSGFDRRRH